MTKLLEKAFNRAPKLPDSSQDAIAAIILEELEDEKKWEISLPILRNLFLRLQQKFAKGETLPFDPASRTK